MSKIDQQVVHEIDYHGTVETKLQPVQFGFDVEAELKGIALANLIGILLKEIDEQKRYRINFKLQELKDEKEAKK
jgi:hypothetical protein